MYVCHLPLLGSRTKYSHSRERNKQTRLAALPGSQTSTSQAQLMADDEEEPDSRAGP
jgi:hypothetical protein